jgi:hypothetical protein
LLFLRSRRCLCGRLVVDLHRSPCARFRGIHQ